MMNQYAEGVQELILAIEFAKKLKNELSQEREPRDELSLGVEEEVTLRMPSLLLKLTEVYMYSGDYDMALNVIAEARKYKLIQAQKMQAAHITTAVSIKKAAV